MQPLSSEYEESGWFDKDEQGWCSTMVRISQEGDVVTIREWHDANGILRSDQTWTARISAVDERQVTLVLQGGRQMFVDRATGRLVKSA